MPSYLSGPLYWQCDTSVDGPLGRPVGEGGAGCSLITLTNANERGNEGYQYVAANATFYTDPEHTAAATDSLLPTFHLPMSCLYIIVSAVRWQ